MAAAFSIFTLVLAIAAAMSVAGLGGSARAQTTYQCVGTQTYVFNNWNGGAVDNGGTDPTFSTPGGQPYCLISVSDYHWNGGMGAIPGTIALISQSGTVGPYQATGSSGQDNAPDVNWTATPPSSSQPVIIQGTYRCHDSDPSTWSQNTGPDGSGGQGFCKVLAQPAQASIPGTTTTTPIAPPPVATVNHYHIEAKAWIPFDRVVDPIRPEHVPFAVYFGDNCYDPGFFTRLFRNEVLSLYNGNNHVAYGDSNADYKVIVSIDFDWDGSQITNFKSSVAYGKTIRYLQYSVEDIITQNSKIVECEIQSAQATSAASAQQVGPNGFKLIYSAAHPIVVGAPAIDGNLFGTIASDGTISLTYDTDLFPSHGFRVIKNGVVQVTNVTNDASCLGSAFGPRGAALIAWGLTHEDNHASFTVNPGDVGVSVKTASQLCSQSYWLSIVTDEGTKVYRSFINTSGGMATDARAASAATRSDAPTIKVALIGPGGRPGHFIALEAAVRDGDVAVQEVPTGTAILSSTRAPIAIAVNSTRPELQVSKLADGTTISSRVYSAAGRVEATLRSSPTVEGRDLSSFRGPAPVPVTTATTTVEGVYVIVRFHVRSPLGVVETFATLEGKALAVRNEQVRVRSSQLHALLFGSIDSLGDVERPHAL